MAGAYNFMPASRSSLQEESPVNTQNPIQLILGYIQSLFGEVGIGWFEGLQALIINLIDALFG